MLKLRANKTPGTTNYVLCCWSGLRRVQDQRYDRDRAYYLRNHIKALIDFKHNLSQISVMVPFDPHEPPEFRKELNALPKKIQKADVVIIERPNIGMSYGSFSDAYKISRTAFNYYIYIEDDGYFMQDYFDDKHIHFLDTHPGCGYICGYAASYAGMPHHAAISAGMMTTVALEKIWVNNGEIPHSKDSSYRSAEALGQVGVSYCLTANGFSILDWRGYYKVGFRHVNMEVSWSHPGHSDETLPPMLGPI